MPFILARYSKPLSIRFFRRLEIALAAAGLLQAIVCFAADGRVQHYAGPEICAKCHQAISVMQITTAMANTWKGESAPSLPASFDQKKTEGPDPALQYEVRRLGDKFEFSVLTSYRGKTVLPVETVMGGKRHGISFLSRIQELDGIPLQRPALIESRYAYSPHGSLVLSPGFQQEKPNNFEDSLGRVLSPGFEQRCLTCHGQQARWGQARTAVFAARVVTSPPMRMSIP